MGGNLVPRVVVGAQKYADLRHALDGLNRAEEALAAARKLQRLTLDRYHALLGELGFSPDDILAYDDSDRTVSASRAK